MRWRSKSRSGDKFQFSKRGTLSVCDLNNISKKNEGRVKFDVTITDN